MKMKVIDTIKWGLMEPKPKTQTTYVREMTAKMLNKYLDSPFSKL